MSDNPQVENKPRPRDTIIFAILEERARQDAQWGGPVHDDSHEGLDWVDYVQKQVDLISNYRAYRDKFAIGGEDENWRDRMVKIAALSIAALEAYERKMARGCAGQDVA